MNSCISNDLMYVVLGASILIVIVLAMSYKSESFVNNPKGITFEKIEDTDCLSGIIPTPGSSNANYTYLGTFDSYDECSRSNQIPSNAKAINYYTKGGPIFGGQCYSVIGDKEIYMLPDVGRATCGKVKAGLSSDTTDPSGTNYPVGCMASIFGCCPDKFTSMIDARGTNCNPIQTSFMPSTPTTTTVFIPPPLYQTPATSPATSLAPSPGTSPATCLAPSPGTSPATSLLTSYDKSSNSGFCPSCPEPAPCPACARCPDPYFESQNGSNSKNLPKPVLADFSGFT